MQMRFSESTAAAAPSVRSHLAQSASRQSRNTLILLVFHMHSLVALSCADNSDLDDKEEWGNGDQIVCNLCPGCSPLSANCAGICAFPQKLKTDEKVNGSLIKSKINDLVNHKCGRCGSCPTKPGNDVNTGEITVNYVTSGCKEGVCDYKRKASRDEVASRVTADQTADEDVFVDQTIDVDDPIDTSFPPGTSENVHALGAPKGINCKGSSFCKTCGDKTIERILRSIDLMEIFTGRLPSRM
ncbi:hypothetical protein J4E91_002552 [Alternaria rosae]|nr:hypothetical protein J4E91_002552 [Alternaria rosae]